MADTINDVKTAGESSTPADATANRSTDVMGSSSTQADASNADVSNQSLGDYLKQNVPGLKDDASLVDETEETTAVDGGEDKSAESEKKDEGTKEKKEEESKEQEAKDSDDKETEEKEQEQPEPNKPVPYERFKEVNEKYRTSEENLKAMEPIVNNYNQIQQYCQEKAITGEQFTKALHLQGLLNTEPDKALPELRAIVDSLEGLVGNKLPSDLQVKVDEGKMEVDDAKEMARLRAQSQFGEKKSAHTLKQQQQREAAATQRQMADSLVTWETTKQKLDPDYVKDSPKWNLVQNTFVAMVHGVDAQGNFKNPVRSAADATALMDKAYSEVAAMLSKASGKKAATRKLLSSNGSSTTSTKATRVEDAKSMKEAIEIQLAQR